jgi:hypothetical protein
MVNNDLLNRNCEVLILCLLSFLNLSLHHIYIETKRKSHMFDNILHNMHDAVKIDYVACGKKLCRLTLSKCAYCLKKNCKNQNWWIVSKFRFSIVRNFLHSHIQCIVIVQMKSNYQHLSFFFFFKKFVFWVKKKIISTSSLIKEHRINFCIREDVKN